MIDYVENLNLILDQETYRQADEYFSKYWLNKTEYIEKWLPIQNSIFNSYAKYLPDMMFNSGFELFPLVGGDIFISKGDFSLVLECIRQIGETHFIIVQNSEIVIGNYDDKNNFSAHPLTRFKYPATITWSEIMSGGIAGCEHFNNGCKDYFIFGASGNWGRYVANSWVQPTNPTGMNPLNIMGFKKEYSNIFKRNFEQLRRIEPEITPENLYLKWLPDSYK